MGQNLVASFFSFRSKKWKVEIRMDHLCLIVIGFVAIIAVIAAFSVAIARKHERRKAKRREEQALNGIARGISDRLHAAEPGSKWRWVCRPAAFAVSGGIGRIDVVDAHGRQFFVDVCFSPSGYMELHIPNVVVLSAADAQADFERPESEPHIPTSPTTTGVKPNDEESVTKWYNIVLIDALTSLIDNLHAKGEVCLYIGQDGKAFVEENGGKTVIYEFGDMPDMDFWSHITEKLGDAGLFAEVQEENCIFVSWA
jgi:hypothetical protein